MPKSKSPSKSRSPKNNYRHGDELGIPSCTAHMWTLIVRIHAIVNRREKIGPKELAAEMDTSYRSVLRAVEFMRDRLDVPIYNDRKLKMYYFTAPCPFLPQVRVDADEPLVLRLIKHLLPAVAGSPAAETYERVMKKFSLSVGSKSPLLSEARPSVLVPTALPNAGEFRHLAVINHAIDHSEKLRLQYLKSGATDPEPRVVHPLDIAYLDQGWVLLLLDEGREQELRTFRLDRISAVALAGARFVRPPDLDINEILRGNIGAFTGKEDHEVRIRLRSFAAADARTRRWHLSQVAVERGNGELEITLRLNNLVDVINRILKWGPLAEALSPPALRASVHDALKATLAAYE